ncbi:hypothetical protein LY78DRAFT_721289 [Colletotrichum sublineola]|nr:hypothetical protein LY78DRAFT_721289 [Colletotrichum sublineola]
MLPLRPVCNNLVGPSPGIIYESYCSLSLSLSRSDVGLIPPNKIISHFLPVLSHIAPRLANHHHLPTMAAPSTRSPILPATALRSWESYSRDTTKVVNWLCGTKKAKQLLSSQDQLHYKLLRDFAKACAHSGESLPTDVHLALERSVKTT